MKAERLLALYEKVAESPDAIARLRRFVLDLAVRGKLVPQDAGDEPVAGHLRRIEAAPEITRECPASWACVPLGNILDFKYGKGMKASERLEKGPVPVFGSNGVVGYTTTPLTDQPAIIIGRKGSAGALNLCNGPSWTTDVAYFVEAPSFLDLQYLFLALQTLELDTLGKGVKPGLSRADAYPLTIPLPPLAEQRRIVAKVEELMALLDRLEAARTAREATRDRLTAASFARLTAPETDAEAFPTHARFALDALAALSARPDQIKSLRQTILNLAVRGKLVPQDPTDDQANQSALRSDKVAESYDKRAFEERVRKFNLPSRWAIQPLSRVAERIVDCPHTTPKWTENGVLCIKTNQVRAGTLDLLSPSFVSKETYIARIERIQPKEDDILYIREGGILGVGCRVPPNTRLCMGQRLMLIRANSSVSPVFLELCLNSPWIMEFATEKTTGGAAPRVNMSLVRGYPIPLPPLVEQHHIVAKVDALMALCDRLEAALTTADTTRARLLEALLHEALAPATERAMEAAE